MNGGEWKLAAVVEIGKAFDNYAETIINSSSASATEKSKAHITKAEAILGKNDQTPIDLFANIASAATEKTSGNSNRNPKLLMIKHSTCWRSTCLAPKVPRVFPVQRIAPHPIQLFDRHPVLSSDDAR